MYNAKYNEQMLRLIRSSGAPDRSPFDGGLVIDRFYAENLIKPLLKAFYAGKIYFDNSENEQKQPEETQYGMINRQGWRF